jgi:hypothetical protein
MELVPGDLFQNPRLEFSAPVFIIMNGAFQIKNGAFLSRKIGALNAGAGLGIPSPGYYDYVGTT